MSSWERARLYLLRKRNKTVLLFAILTVIAVLILTCISMGNAAEAAGRKLRETIGGYFKVVTNTEQGYTQPVDDELVREILGLEGIKSYNGIDTAYLLTQTISLIPGRFTAANDPKAKLARFIGNTDSSLNEYFILRSFTLIEGRHINQEDVGKGLISKELSLANNLTVGDTFTAVLNKEELLEKQAETVQPYTFEIVGIYEINTTQNSGSADSAECDMAENFVFVDTASIRAIHEPLLGRPINSYQNGAAFFVTDPKDLDEIVSGVSAIDGCDWDGYKVTKNNEAYSRSAVPLARVSGLLAAIVAALALISVVLLTLILTMWMRDRVHEIGILLSIGVKKWNIISQHILENILVAALALLLAWGIANVSADKIGNLLFTNVQEEQEAAPQEQVGFPLAESIASPHIQTEELMKINVGAAELFEVAGIGFLIVVISTCFSSVIIVSRKPKDILSKMS